MAKAMEGKTKEGAEVRKGDDIQRLVVGLKPDPWLRRRHWF